MPLILLRHAHAGSRHDWEGDDRIRPLSEKGERQAKSLAIRLADLAPTAIRSSPTVRCRQTVVPLAEQFGLAVTDDDRLFEGAGRQEVRSLLAEVAGETIVLCSHGDVIPELLRELTDQGMRHQHALIWPKASGWIVDHTADGWGRATYVSPPS